MMELLKYEKGPDNDRFAIGCFGMVLFMLSPLWLGQLGVHITKNILDKPCSESTGCIWLMVPDYVYYTVPMGGLLLLFYVPVWLLTNHEIDVSDPPVEDSTEDSTTTDDS